MANNREVNELEKQALAQAIDSLKPLLEPDEPELDLVEEGDVYFSESSEDVDQTEDFDPEIDNVVIELVGYFAFEGIEIDVRLIEELDENGDVDNAEYYVGAEQRVTYLGEVASETLVHTESYDLQLRSGEEDYAAYFEQHDVVESRGDCKRLKEDPSEPDEEGREGQLPDQVIKDYSVEKTLQNQTSGDEEKPLNVRLTRSRFDRIFDIVTSLDETHLIGAEANQINN